MANKYNAKKVKYAGITFDSKAEYERYLILKHLHGLGRINDLKVHVRYWIHVAGQKAFQYEVDFLYRDHNGKEVAEDVKGVLTSTSRLKIKCFKLEYPDIEFVLIHKGKRVEKL